MVMYFIILLQFKSTFKDKLNRKIVKIDKTCMSEQGNDRGYNGKGFRVKFAV